ncbi:LUD domain-containing protein, partial [Streptomyces hirsutus]|uniref:LUD domain-containing protein n=1 Tax=Streptomyces hirsutus TaxID=35620 RepID=UPI00340F8858
EKFLRAKVGISGANFMVAETGTLVVVALAAHGVGDAQELEDFLTGRLGMPAAGGHRFGDELEAPRVRLSTAPLLGDTAEQRAECLGSSAPLELPHVRRALTHLKTVFDDLRDDAQRGESHR